MRIITADYVYTDGIYQKDFAVVFDERIISIGAFESMIERYPDAEVEDRVSHSVLYPGFINTHVHLEFSTNKTTLKYGDFIPWLYSVIEDRNHLAEICDTEIMLDACRSMLKSGITSFGAISSMGLDLDACIEAPQRVIFFNELIGSHPETADAAYEAFVERYRVSMGHSEERVEAAIAIHSPYSVRPSIAQKAIGLAKSDEAILSSHFLESEAERQWLDHSEGEFKTFFQTFFSQDKALSSIEEYLSWFDGYPTHFTHCVHADKKELKKIADEKHTIAHCPRSNRYLGCGRLKIETLDKLAIPFTLATDGLSSNYSLNIFDEMRAALMMHADLELDRLSKQLIDAVTRDAATVLKLNCGKIREGYEADFAVVQLPEAPKQEEEIALWTILHTNEVAQLYIAGERYI